MKALTERQAAALEKIRAQNSTQGIDRGMIRALKAKNQFPISLLSDEEIEVAVHNKTTSTNEHQDLDTQVERVNLMTGAKYMEDVNTPRSCSPSTELYWAM